MAFRFRREHRDTARGDPFAQRRSVQVHGILAQPLPSNISTCQVLEAISVERTDGFHLYNVGVLVVGSTIFSPCTPYGVVKLLEHERIAVEGQNVVVVGASNIIGKPMAPMLMQKDATVCVCHAKHVTWPSSPSSRTSWSWRPASAPLRC